MKKWLILILFSSIIVSCNSPVEEKKESGPCLDLEGEMAKVALVLEKYRLANETQKIELLREVWAPVDDIVVFGTNSDEKLLGWEAIKDVIEVQFTTFKDTYISVRDQVIKVNETGNTAWFSEVLSYNYIYEGKAVKYEGLRFTGVLEKIDGDWLIVQSHISIPGSPQ